MIISLQKLKPMFTVILSLDYWSRYLTGLLVSESSPKASLTLYSLPWLLLYTLSPAYFFNLISYQSPLCSPFFSRTGLISCPYLSQRFCTQESFYLEVFFSWLIPSFHSELSAFVTSENSSLIHNLKFYHQVTILCCFILFFKAFANIQSILDYSFAYSVRVGTWYEKLTAVSCYRLCNPACLREVFFNH